MRLARWPADINLGTVVRDIESDCDLECFATSNCRLAGVFQGDLAMYLEHIVKTRWPIHCPGPTCR